MEKSIKITDWDNNEFTTDDNGLTYRLQKELGSDVMFFSDRVSEIIELLCKWRFKKFKAFYRKWKNVNDELPKESGRYWCYVEDMDDLGTGYYQSNCGFTIDHKIWSENLKIIKVLFWTELADCPL